MKNYKLTIFLSSLFLTIFYNSVFFSKTYAIFHNIIFMISVGFLLFCVIALLIVIFSGKYTLKPFLIYLFLTGSLSAYFMQKYGIVIDKKMIQNVFETDIAEAMGLFNFKLLIYFIVLGVLPSFVIYKIKIEYPTFFKNIIFKLKFIPIILILIIGNVLVFSKAYTSFFREHKILRVYTNPVAPFYNLISYLNQKYFSKPIPFQTIGMDAKLITNSNKKPKLFIFVVGEAARADHFELNGYKKDTNPLLKNRDDIVSLKNFYSCGTETAVSVPCMFSDLARSNYKDKIAKNRSSLIDILHKAGVRVLWIDNNSDSKGVAVRIKNYKNIKGSCSGECRDIEMLKGLDEFVKEPRTTFIVLHQMGSHGPEYYKRYPKSFEKFKPICKTNQLQECTKEEIRNAYDNTILYTDYFLDKVIEFLKKHKDRYRVGMWYSADHGESLGEAGIYLHGLPYFIAPDAQKHPGALLWFDKDFGIPFNKIKSLENKKLSQDYIFNTVLKLMDINTSLYNKNLDMFEK